MLKLVTKLLLLPALILVLSGCSTGDKPAIKVGQEKIRIVAAENFYGEVAQAVGGDNVQVVSILSAGVMNPERYVPTPQNAKDVANANIVVYSGLGYDPWMEKLVSASADPNRKILVVGSDLLGYKQGDNPHIWYNLETFPELSEALAAELAKLDPANAEIYRKNADDYSKSLEPLFRKLDTLIQATPVPFEESETIFEYSAKKLNLVPQTKKFALAVFNGVDPAPADLIKIEKNIREKKVRFLLYNASTKNQDVDRLVALANEVGLPVVRVTEQRPNNITNLTWMLGQLNELESALNGK